MRANPDWTCGQCGEQRNSYSEFLEHLNFHEYDDAKAAQERLRKQFTALPDASQLPLAKATEALRLVTDKGEVLLASLLAHRGAVVMKITDLNAEVLEIDRRIRQLDVILSLNAGEVMLQNEGVPDPPQLVFEDLPEDERLEYRRELWDAAL